MEPNQTHKINSRSVVQQTMDYITDSIIRKELLPGDQIPTEAQLTEILGVSRNTVREAIKIMVAMGVLEDYRRETGDPTPILTVSTASPYKFSADVATALDVPVSGDAFDAAAALEKATGVPAPQAVKELSSLPVRHTRVCEKDRMGEAVLQGFA